MFLLKNVKKGTAGNRDSRFTLRVREWFFGKYESNLMRSVGFSMVMMMMMFFSNGGFGVVWHAMTMMWAK